MFKNGYFSSDSNDPYRVDQIGLKQLDESRLAKGFQVSDANPLVGLSGRLELLHGLGASLSAYADDSKKGIRLGDVYDQLYATAMAGKQKTLSCLTILATVLARFGNIWPGGLVRGGCNLGDVGVHPLIKGRLGSENLVPFHKLSQWLSYSLAETFELAGLKVSDVEQLTGLPEYHNGGLLIDLGVLTLKDPSDLHKPHKPQSELVVEWRALTVAILDLIAEGIRKSLGRSQLELPLAKILQGGSWSAGRRIAKSLRQDGGPPTSLDSDGTVF